MSDTPKEPQCVHYELTSLWLTVEQVECGGVLVSSDSESVPWTMDAALETIHSLRHIAKRQQAIHADIQLARDDAQLPVGGHILSYEIAELMSPEESIRRWRQWFQDNVDWEATREWMDADRD